MNDNLDISDTCIAYTLNILSMKSVVHLTGATCRGPVACTDILHTSAWWNIVSAYKKKSELQEIWANAHEKRDSISLIMYAGWIDLSLVYFTENSL